MKKTLLLFSILLMASSCSQYQKVLKNDDISEKYALGEKLYNEGLEKDSNTKLRRAVRLFDQISNQYRGRPQAQKLMYMLANAYYELGDYYLAGYQLDQFARLYPESEKNEEALFKSAESYYFVSPRYSLDQTETVQAIDKLQEYINKFPEGKYLDQANSLIVELRVKLDRKAYEIAKQYHHRMWYSAAVAAFDNFIVDYPGSPYRERAYYYRFDSAYRLAINSIASKEDERLAAAAEFFNAYQRYYPEGEFLEEARKAYEDIQNRRRTEESTL